MQPTGAMSPWPIRAVVVSVLLTAALPASASAYSVLAHESSIDAAWDASLQPLLLRRFPGASADELREARAYGYGGAVIQDLGYYPFGSHFFSNLLHYVRSGDFIETMIRNATSINEYAFALGALAHYAADNTGHPSAVNRAVPLMFPKLRARFGPVVPYANAPAQHVIVEFSFDVVQAATGAYASDAYHSFIGFKVAKPLLQRAFRETYGLEIGDVFLFDEDLAIGTYRRAVSEWIPKITEVAWRDKRTEIETLSGGMGESRFLFAMSRRDYEQTFGTEYKRPGILASVVTLLYRLLPKIGPLRPLTFEAPPAQAEAIFVASLIDTRRVYGQLLEAVADNRLALPNTNFDTGRATARGDYDMADETYAALLDRTDKRGFASTPSELREHLSAYYTTLSPTAPGKKARRRAERIQRQLAMLRATLDNE